MIVLDVEIEKAILARGETPVEGISYCQGWRDFSGMGIACVATYDTDTHLSRAFTSDNQIAFLEYIAGKPTAGFNTRRFDIPLLQQHGCWPDSKPVQEHLNITPAPHYDILEEIWLALGLNPDKFNPRTHGGWGLDAVCGATLGIHKTGNGALAPVWWQQGQHGKVIDYCLNDVWMEGQLFLHIIKHDGLVTNGRDQVRVRVPDRNDGGASKLTTAQIAQGLNPEEPRDGLTSNVGGLGIVR